MPAHPATAIFAVSRGLGRVGRGDPACSLNRQAVERVKVSLAVEAGLREQRWQRRDAILRHVSRSHLQGGVALRTKSSGKDRWSRERWAPRTACGLDIGVAYIGGAWLSSASAWRG